ncbi:hypothetical protein HJFPF1_12196 [Paramyrothecium foliicola]|nr:hypothetical protein HJFPF1_12196 [Paramyrothecium foliicola]
MKPSALFVAACAAPALAAQHAGAAEKCGRLRPMVWNPDDLPEGVTPAMVRMCADHPAGAGNYWGLGQYLPDWVPRNPFAP